MNESLSLEEAFAEFSNRDYRIGCNKFVSHGYAPMYEELLSSMRGTAVKLLEIGVATGSSLMGWRRYFGDAAEICGIENDCDMLLPHCHETVHFGDACSSGVARMFDDSSLDVIIDDGSHRVDDQWAAFQNFWPKLREGGIYIIEDIGEAFAFAVRFSGHAWRWYDTRHSAQNTRISQCAVFQKGSAARPGSRLVAYTLRYGDHEWIRKCAASLDSWSGVHGVDLRTWGKPADGLYPSPKFVIIEMLRDFLEKTSADHMLYIDADVFVHPEAPPFPVCPGFMAMTDESHRKWNGDWEQWCHDVFGERPAGFSYRNAGLWVCDRDSARRLLDVAAAPFYDRVQDQHQFNWWLYLACKSGLRLTDLHPTWNRDSASGRCAWMWHLWGRGDKMAKLRRIERRGLLSSRASSGIVVADCAWQQKRGLGNRITLLCDAYAHARTRGMEFAFTWRKTRHCGAAWEDLFQPIPGISQIDQIPAGAEVRREDSYYKGNRGLRNSPEFWSAWREMARMIVLADGLDLPDCEPFDAVSLRLTHPRGAYHNRDIIKLPRLENPFVASDCPQGLEWIREVMPSAWDLHHKLFNADDVRRDVEHMRGAARDMMMLARARSIIALGRESSFRNLAHIGYGVPVLRFYDGLAP